MKKRLRKLIFLKSFNNTRPIFILVLFLLIMCTFINFEYKQSKEAAAGTFTYTENFTTTTYKDVANTTGKWDTGRHHSRLFGKIWTNMAQTIEGYDNVSNSTTNNAWLNRWRKLNLDSFGNPYIYYTDGIAGHLHIYFTKWTPGPGPCADPIGCWTNMAGDLAGPEIISNTTTVYTDPRGASMLLDSNNIPYIVWTDQTYGSGDILITKWTPGPGPCANPIGCWTNMAGTASGFDNISNNASGSSLPIMQLDSNNRPNVMWEDWAGSRDIFFSKWTAAGPAICSGQPACWTKMDGVTPGYENVSNTNASLGTWDGMALDSGNNPNIIWNTGNTQIWFTKWTTGLAPGICAGGATACWTNIANTTLPLPRDSIFLGIAGNTWVDDIIVNSSNIVYVTVNAAFAVPGNNDIAFSKGTPGAGWTTMDGSARFENLAPGTSAGMSYFVHNAVYDLAGDPLIVWMEDATGVLTTVTKWTPTAPPAVCGAGITGCWTNMAGTTKGFGYVPVGNQAEPNFVLDSNKNPNIIYLNYHPTELFVYFTKWTALGWTMMYGDVGSRDLISTKKSNYPSSQNIALDSSNNPIVEWNYNFSGVRDIYVSRWKPTFNLTSNIQSLNVNTSGEFVTDATLNTTQTDSPPNQTLTYYLSNDGGTTWDPVSRGVLHTFTTVGKDLRWKAALSTNDNTVSPIIDDLSINYTSYADVTPPTITITAPTKLLNTNINDTTIHITDDFAINEANVLVDPLTSAGVSNFNCTQTDSKTVDCDIVITGSGDLIIAATDIATNNATKTEIGYVITTNTPTISINAPTKISNVNITDTTIHVTDPDGVLIANVTVDPSTTLTYSGGSFICTQIDAFTVDCTIIITLGGNLAIKAIDNATNQTIQTEFGYLIDMVPPVIAITAPTKVRSENITNTTIHVTDDNSVNMFDVTIDPSTTVAYSNFNCVQTDIKTVDCTIIITDSGNLVIKAVDIATNSALQSENNYLITAPITSPAGSFPTAPIDFSCIASSPDTIRWSFTDTATNETGFRLYGPAGLIQDTGAEITTDLSYFDEKSLSVNTQYIDRYVKAFNGAGESNASNTASCFTLANVPSLPEQLGTTDSNINIAIKPNDGNPLNTEYSIKELTTNKYIDANGLFSDTETWQTFENWGGVNGINVLGYSQANPNQVTAQFKMALSSGTNYQFAAKARNGDGIETAFSPSLSASTTGATTPSTSGRINLSGTKGVAINLVKNSIASFFKTAFAENTNPSENRNIALRREFSILLNLSLIILAVFFLISVGFSIKYLFQQQSFITNLGIIAIKLIIFCVIVVGLLAVNHESLAQMSEYDQSGVTVNAGDTLNYIIEIQNNSSAPANNIVVNDVLDSHLSYISGSAKLNINSSPIDIDELMIGQTLTLRFANIPANATAFLTFDAKIKSGSDEVTISNTASGSSDGGGAFTTNTVSNFVRPSIIKYSCNATRGTCSVNSTGNFTSLSACQDACKIPTAAKYACNAATGSCFASTTGSYLTLSDCQSACKNVNIPCVGDECVTPPIFPICVGPDCEIPPLPPTQQNYSCDTMRGQCIANANGPFANFSDCQSSCAPVINANIPPQPPILPPIISSITSPEVNKIATNYITPALLSIAAVNTIPTAIILISYLLPYLHLLFIEPLLWLFRRKRKKWGIVYNALSKVPVDLAVVRLYRKADKKLVQTRVTDRAGRYIMIVREKGEYYLSVSKPGFAFPTRYLSDEKQDSKYIDLYHGEAIEVTAKDAAITANIPLDPSEKKIMPERAVIFGYLFKNLRVVTAYIGVILATLIFIIYPSWITGLAILLHLLLLAIFLRLIVPAKPKSWGIVYDQKSKKPLHYAVVRIFDIKFNKLLETQVTDNKGRYSFLVGQNQYQLLAEKEGYIKREIKPVDLIEKEEIVNLDLGLQKT